MTLPLVYQVNSITHDTHDVFTLALSNKDGRAHQFSPGQFNMLYQFGIGESAISISGNPKDKKNLIHTIRAVGSVTNSLQRLKPGDEIGVRGPFGTPWPLELTGGDVLVIAGGIGLAALRSALFVLAENSHLYRKVTLLYGTRTLDDILFIDDLRTWKSQGIEVEITLDYADIHWQGNVGVVTRLIQNYLRRPKTTLVLVCGPEIMIKFALHELMGQGIDESNIYVSMERNMQCGVGFCGHCQFGPYFLCKDGPVFSFPQIKNFLTVKEL